MCWFLVSRLFVSPSVFREFSVKIYVPSSNPRLRLVKHRFQRLFITRRPLTNTNESQRDKWIWRTPCAPDSSTRFPLLPSVIRLQRQLLPSFFPYYPVFSCPNILLPHLQYPSSPPFSLSHSTLFTFQHSPLQPSPRSTSPFSSGRLVFSQPLSRPGAAFVSLSFFLCQSPSSLSLPLCLSASCESVPVLPGLAMGCSAKCSGAPWQSTQQLSDFSFIQPVGFKKKDRGGIESLGWRHFLMSSFVLNAGALPLVKEPYPPRPSLGESQKSSRERLLSCRCDWQHEASGLKEGFRFPLGLITDAILTWVKCYSVDLSIRDQEMLACVHRGPHGIAHIPHWLKIDRLLDRNIFRVY